MAKLNGTAKGRCILNAADLRRITEDRLAQYPVFTALTEDPDPVKLLHELQVYQVELEMQNEALLKSYVETAASSKRLELALDAANAGLWDWDLEADAVYLSPRYYDMSGYSPREAGGGVEFLRRIIHPDDFARVLQAMQGRLENETGDNVIDYRLCTRNGRILWVQGMGRVTERDADGTPLRVAGIVVDISEIKRADAQLRIAAVAFQSRDGMIVTDARGAILQVNRAFTEVTGYSAEEAIGKTPALLHSGRHGAAFYRTMWEAIAREGHWEGEIWNRRRDGGIYPEWLSISGVRDSAGEITHYLGTFSDINDPREARRKILELAYYDFLTGLPNRRLLLDRLHHAIAASARNNEFGAVLLLDLDHFKVLNDTRGHNAGDELLIEVARRLRATLRECDSAARLGGDEFVILLEGLGEEQFAAASLAESIAEKLRSVIGEAFVLNDQKHHITPSIGVTLFRHDRNTDADALLQQTDLALYQAKGAGRNATRFYSPEMQAAVDARAKMEAELRQAIEQGELELHYQPKVEMAHGGVISAEALIRWNHPSGGLMAPAEFILLAEETGLIIPIGAWVIDTACAQMRSWQDQGLPRIPIAVNVSAKQFQQADLAGAVAKALKRWKLQPHYLELELTESAVMADPEKTIAALKELKAIGVRIALDDFGTGYSSLTHLKRFPIDSLKIDQSFVRDITADPDDAAIARMVITLAHSMNRKVIAEGVETRTQLKFLQQQRCDEMQGFLFSRPLPAAQFAALLDNVGKGFRYYGTRKPAALQVVA